VTISPRDWAVIFECIRATVEGDFIDEAEFRIVFSRPRDALRPFLERAPHLDLTDNPTIWLLMMVLTHLNATATTRAGWADWISVDPTVVAAVSDRLHALLPPLEYTDLQIYGPVELAGRFYRLIDYRLANGGQGTTRQEWDGQRWVVNTDGPGCPTIRGTPAARDQALTQAGVDVSPLPPGYDPGEAGATHHHRVFGWCGLAGGRCPLSSGVRLGS
jgi:hypothetical protein